MLLSVNESSIASDVGRVEDEDASINIDGGEEEEGGSTKDGLADMMQRILHQHVEPSAIPVLAKRKTSLMKEIESSRRDSVESKKLRRAKQLDRAKQLAAPDSEPSAIDFERQLRKIATRGVVALFNAISKAKREAATEVSAKKDAGIKKDVQVPTIETQLKGTKRGPPVGEAEGDTAGRRWAAVRDDYMVGSQLSAKNWDRAPDDDSESEQQQ